LIWVGFIFFFMYSYQAIIDLGDVIDPHRRSQFIRILTAFAQPNLFEYEYETRETTIALEKDCRNPNDITQELRMGDSTLRIDLDCSTSRRPTYTVQGTGFLPSTTGYIIWYPEETLQPWQKTPFTIDQEGSFLVTDIPFRAEAINIGHEVVIVEQVSKTFRGLSKVSYETARGMWETIQMAFLATAMSAILAIAFTFLSARASSPWGRAFKFLLQPVLAAIRSVHPLITVIPVIILVGIGPTAGVLALTFFTTAILISDFSDYAHQQTSLNWTTLLKIHFPGLAFRRFPITIAIATVIGFMGAGGVGFFLQLWINLLNYHDASVALIAIIISIGSLDLLSRAVWQKIQKGQ